MLTITTLRHREISIYIKKCGTLNFKTRSGCSYKKHLDMKKKVCYTEEKSDDSTNEKALLESFLKADSQGRRIRQESPMWIKLKSDVHKQIDYLQGTFEETKQTTGISV